MTYDIIIGRGKSDAKKFGNEGVILLAKQYVTMGRTTSLANNIYMDVAKAHVVFVCGKRGSGKCLHEDTLITLEDGSQVKIKNLKDSNENIFAMNGEYKINSVKKEGFYKRETDKLLEVTLRSGKIIKLTPEHPLFTIKGWLPAKELNVGSRIATPREIRTEGTGFLEEDKIKILAYLIAEGHLGNNFVLFSNQDKKIINEFKNSIKEFDSELVVKKHGKFNWRVVKNFFANEIIIDKMDEQGRILHTVHDRKSSLRKWLDKLNLYNTRSNDKFVPNIILNLPNNKITIFLNRLFSCDGCIHKYNESWFVSYCSKSEQLIRQVQHLLLRFGINSRIRTKNHAYEIVICGEFVRIYCEKIGFYGEKEIKQKTALKEMINVVRNPNVDTIPKEIWDLYRPANWARVGKKMNYAHPKALRESIRYSPSRQKLMVIAQADENEMLETIASSDIFWDEIVSVREMEGNFTVYDFTVPEHHNFVANDVIVHNSYTMGAIAEGAATLPEEVSQNLAFLLLDTMGIYWTMKYPNLKDKELLEQWGIKGNGLPVRIFTPKGYFKDYKKKGIPTDFPFAIKPSELQPQDWFLTFGLKENESIAVLIERVLNSFEDDFDLDDIIKKIKENDEFADEVKNAAQNRFENAKTWGVFDKEGTPLSDLAVGGTVTILDVSCYATAPNGWAIKSLVVGLVSQKLFNERMLARKNEEFESIKQMTSFGQVKEVQKMDKPLVWLVIDEAHEFLPSEGTTAASQALITILREGRQPGISLILATQQPGKIHTDVLTQSDLLLAHRITARIDIDALKMLSASYMSKGIDEHLRMLPHVPGASLIIDDKNERMYSVRMRPRSTWHGGEAPIAIKKKKNIF